MLDGAGHPGRPDRRRGRPPAGAGRRRARSRHDALRGPQRPARSLYDSVSEAQRRRGDPPVLQLVRPGLAPARRAGAHPGPQRLRPGPGRRRDRRQPRPDPRTESARATMLDLARRSDVRARPADRLQRQPGRPRLRAHGASLSGSARSSSTRSSPRCGRTSTPRVPHPGELRPLRLRLGRGGGADVPARLPRRARRAARPGRAATTRLAPGARQAGRGLPEAQLPARPRRGPRPAAPLATSRAWTSSGSARPTATASSTTSTTDLRGGRGRRARPAPEQPPRGPGGARDLRRAGRPAARDARPRRSAAPASGSPTPVKLRLAAGSLRGGRS